MQKVLKNSIILQNNIKQNICLQISLNFAEVNYMNFKTPIEMPRGTHYGNNYYVVYSSKIKRVCHFFSNLEYYNFLSLEINPEVNSFCEQPLKIEIIQDNAIKCAVFDMWVKYRNGREELQEVKYDAELNGNDAKSIRAQEQIRREEQWCILNNIDFVIRTDKNIPQGRFFLSNANVICSRLRRYIPTEDRYYNPRIINALQRDKVITIENLMDKDLLPVNNEINHLCYMYEKGLIHMNIESRPLDYKTEVSLWQN